MPPSSLPRRGWGLVVVRGPSMVPALRDGDVVVVRWAAGVPRVGDIVVVALPDRPVSVKRVSGISPYGGGIGVFVEGDNPYASTDSRTLGTLPGTAVLGTVRFRLWPQPGRPSSRMATFPDDRP